MTITAFDCPSCGYNYGGLLDCIAAAYGLDEAMKFVLPDKDGIRMLKCQRPDGSCTQRWSIEIGGQHYNMIYQLKQWAPKC